MENGKKEFALIPDELLFTGAKTHFTSTQVQIFAFLIRYTFGENKEKCVASYSYIAQKIKRSERNIIRALKDLKDRNIIIHYGYTEKGENIWGFNNNYSEWKGIREEISK